MRKVELTMDEQMKYEIIKKLVDANGNKKRAQKKLKCSRRHINRLIANYKKHGKAAFSHGNKGKTPVHAIAEERKNEICLLYENKYYDANFTHFTEMLKEIEGVTFSESTIRNIMHKKGILSPKAQKEKLKAMKENAPNCQSRETKTVFFGANNVDFPGHFQM
ncbi:MAG TPA: helix-turn-helix domain-containing protein [Spirochaetota bacterium]|nr:helix-turn-helix domain-containing protein [Spirochaetota bacterium]